MSVINLSKKDLQTHFFSDLGIKSDDVVFFFSGLRGLGFVEKGPLGVLEVLEEYLEVKKESEAKNSLKCA